MFLAFVCEETDKLGRKRYVARLGDLGEEKPYGMLGLGFSWSHKEIATLMMFRFDLPKAAEILGRTEKACGQKLYQLGLAMGVNLKKQTPQIMLVFSRAQIELRKAVVKQVLPRLKKLLDKIDKAEDLSPESINDLELLHKLLCKLYVCRIFT